MFYVGSERDMRKEGIVVNIQRSAIAAIVLFFVSCPLFAAENSIWEVKTSDANYMKYFGRRIVDVNRAEATRLIPQEFGWQGNQLIFIFNLTSSLLQTPQYDFEFEVISNDYESDEPVELDIYAGTNINNLKAVAQGINIMKKGKYAIPLPSSLFYLGSQNFIKVFGRNVRPIGYGNNPPNCRFGAFRLVISE